MDSLLDKNLITTREASELSGYHSDYLGRLCREGKISGSRVGRSWVIDRSSILRFVEEQELQKKKNAEELAHSREEEYKAVQAAKTPISAPVVVPTTPAVVRAVVPPAPAPVSIPSPYFSPKELQEKMVATLVAFLVITVGLYGSEAKFVERGARVAVETLENTSDIGTQAIASALKQGAVQLAAFRIGQEKFGMAFVSRVESGLVLYKGTITGAGEQLATDEVIAISSGAIDSLASQGSNGIVDTLIGSAVALGNTVVGASDAILNAHNNLATAWAEGSAAVPPRLITAFYGAGTEAIALVSNVPSAIALGYENATYAWIASTQDLAMRITRAELSVGTVALERTNDVVIALTTPEVPSDGARGALAELFETRLTTPSTPTRSLAAASAATDFFAPARSLALFTYETINGFFSRTGAVLAGMFAPNIAYAPEVSTIPTPLTVTSVTNIATSSSYITYITNPVSYIYSGTGGASIAYVQKAMDNLRRDLADRDDNNNSGGGLADITGSSIEELSDVATMTKSFGDVFLWNGTEWTNVATSSLGIGAGTGAPGGASGQVQYNNAGVFAGDAGFTYDVGAGRLTATYASTTGISTAYASSTLLRAGTAIIDSLSATLATLTGLIATDATTTNATSTNLAVMNSFALGADRFTDLTGPGLTASSGTLAVDDVTPAMLQAADFGAFTCNGTSCALDAASISDTHINFGSVTLADFTNDAGFITSAITSVGPTGQMQTGSAITLATTSTAFNGLTASTTITASGNIITFANTLSGRLGVAGGGTGTTTAPTYGQLLVGDGSGGYALLATSSLGISGGTPGGANGQVQFNNAGAFGGSAAFTFDSTAGRLSASYASTTGFSSVYASSTNLFAGNLTLGALSGILKASGGVVSVATAGVDYLTSAITSIGPAGALQTGAAITLATSTAGTDFTITAAGNTLTFNLPSASATNRGVLSSADWSVFNNKISSTSLSASAPLSYNPSTGSFTITQATTGTNGYVSAADFTTFNNKISSTSLSAGAGISYVPATGVITNTGVLTTSGDWTGTFDGQQGTYYLDRTNHTGTQLASTISDFASVARSLFSSSATGLTYTAGTGAFSLTSGYVIPLVASTTQWDTAFSWGNHATAGYENALSFIYPLVRTVDAISLAFGTTTANTWGAQQTFTGIFATNASSTNATTTNLTVNGAFRGAGLTSCSASGDKLLWNSTTGQFTCGADAGAGGGITAIGAQYSTFQTGSSQTFATSSDTNLGLIITSAGDTHTFMPTWIGTLASGRLNSNVVQGVTNDTNVTGSISAQNLTLGWTGLLSVARGGTGWGNLQANTVLLGNGTGAISTTSAGSNGQVLALVGGVPTWVATSSINNGVASIQQTGGGVAQTGAITFATSSATNNGVTIGLNITNTGGAFTFTPSRSGTLTVAGGGTGVGTFTSGQLLYGNGTNALSSVATTTFTPSGEFTTTGTIGALIGGSNSTISLATNGVALTKLAQIAANTILGNATGATGNVTAIATSTLFGTGTGGRVLTWNNGAPQWIATTTYSAPLVFSAGNVTITQAGTGANGYLSSTDFNTFNNKISSTSLSGASVISYNSGTGVITTTGGTFGAGNYIFPGNVTAPYASSTAISSAYASSTNAFFGTLNIGALTGILKATGGVVSAATAGVDYLTSAITSIGPAGQGQTGSSITLATSTAGADFTITAAGNAITFNLPSATATARGLLSIADWSMFNNKISSTSLSATAPLSYNSGTGAFTITQATTGADGYLSSIDFNTFNNKVSSSSLALVKDWFVTTNIFGQSSLAPTTTQNIAVSGTGTSSFAGGLEAWRSIGAPYFTATSSSATSTFAGGVTVASGGINLVSSGRIGVGTAAPSSLLTAQYSFAGTNPLTVTDGSNNLFQVTSSGALAFGASYGYGAGSAVNFGRGLGSVSSGNYFVINPGSADSSSYTFRVQEGGTDQFVVNGDGNVGIGTTSPYAKLSVQGNAGISGNLAAANVVATGTLQVAGQTTLATSLSGLLKATAGVIGNAVAGTDYVAGGAGAATTTLSTSGVLSFTANPVVFGSSPISLSITQSGTGASGYLSSTDFNTFNNKISSTSLSAGAGISYVSGTGVITNTGVTSLAGTANQITASAATGAITLSVPSQFNIQQASTTMLSSNGPIYIGTTSTTTIRGNATSTFSGGVNLATGGCYAIGGVCISASGLGAVTSVTNADGTLTISPTTGSVVASLNLGNANVWTALQQFGRASSTQLSAYSAYFGSTATSSFAANGALTLSTALTAVNGGTGQSSYATGDILYADSASSLARLPVSTNGLVLKLVGGVPSWQPDITTGGGGGAGAWSTTTDSLAIYPSDTSDVIIVGASATSTLNSILEVAGRSYFSNTIGIATTSASSLFKLAVQGNALLSGNLSAANITATGTATVGNLTIGSLTGVLKAASGVVSAATAGVDFENPLSFIYPLVRTVDSISLAFGTTTANTWGAQNTFTGLFATNASSTNATTTNLHITSASNGGLASDVNGRVYSAATTTAGTGLTYSGNAFNVNTSQNISTLSNLTSNGLIKTSGGTGALSIATPGTDYVAGGAGAATTTLSTSGALSFSANPVVFGSSPITLSLGIVPVSNGGSGWGAIQAGAIPYGNGTGALATTTQGTGGFVLAWLNGIPTWTATSSISNGLSSIGPAGFLQTGPAITLATSSTAFNGLTASTTITATGNTITFANTLAGVLGVGGGGTGSSTPLGGILTGNGTGAITSATVSAPLTFSGNTLAITQATTGASGYLSSTDFNTFNNKISSTSLSGASVISYNSGTGVITTTGGTFGAGSYVFPGSVTAPYASSTAFSSAYASSTNAFFGTLSIGNLSGVLKATAGLVSAATAGVDYENPLSFVYPIVRSVNSISLAFGTTTQNFWSAYNNFSSLFATNASSTNATTTNLHITSASNGGLATDASGRVYSAATTTAGTGLTYSGNAFSVNTSQNIATLSNLTSNGLIKTSGGTGALSIATPGTDYIAGGAGAATTTLSTSGVLSLSANPVVFGSSPITLSITQSGTGASGYLSQTDFNTFNNKVSSSSLALVKDWFVTTNIFGQSALAPTTTQNIAVNGTGTSTVAGGIEAWRSISAPYFVATGTAATSTLMGGLIVDTNTLVADYSSGRVGVGTASPGAKLEVFGGSIKFMPTGGATDAYLGIEGATATNYLILQTRRYDNNALSRHLAINPEGGNVSVGTTTAYSKLTAWGTGSLFEAVTNASSTVFSIGQNGATTTAFAISGIPSALLKTNANGSIIPAVAGTDYIAGGAGAATTTLSGNSQITLSQPVVIFGSSPSTLSITADSIGDTQLAFNTGQNLTTASTPTFGGLTLTNALTVPNGGTGWGNIQAGAIPYGNGTGALATTTQGTGGFVLAWLNGIPTWVATSSINNGITAIGPTGQQVTSGAVTLASSTTGTDFTITGSGNTLTFNLPSASASNRGLLTSGDWSTFQNKISSTSLSGASVISYNSGTGVITTTGGTFGAGNYVFPGSVTAPYASSTALSSAYASSTNAFFGNLSIGTLTGLLKATAGVVSTATAGVDYENPLSFVYPIIRSVNSISLAFGTTTQNFWSAYNNFGSLFATNASSTNATTTNLHITSASNGGLATDANGRVYSAATTTAGTGLTYSGNAFNVNTSQNIATLSNLTSNGLIKTSGGTGALSIATPGTDYIAGGAGAATTTLTISGPFTTSATPVVFGSSPITATYYGLATTSTLTSSQLLVSNGAAGVYGVSTTSATINNGLTGTLTTLGSGQTIGLAAIAANTVLANGTGGSAVPTAIATSTFFGTGTGGQVLTWNNGVPQWVATTTYSSPLIFASGNVTIQNAAADGATKGAASFGANDFDASSGNVTLDYTNGQKASASLPGFLTAADWSVFNNKVSSSSLDTYAALYKDWLVTTNIFGQSSLAPTTTRNIAVNGTGTSTFAGGLEAWRSIGAPYFVATSTTATSTFSGGALLATGGGNVGIGTTSPTSALGVNGNIQIPVIDSGGLKIGGTARLGVDNSTQTTLAYTGASGFRLLDSANARVPFTVELGATSNSLYVRSTGNIGIGTTTPDHKLDIYSTTDTKLKISGTGNDYIKLDRATVGNWFIGFISGSLAFDTSSLAGGGSKFLVTTAGNVGIGSTTPYARLGVSGFSSGAGIVADALSGFAGNLFDLKVASTTKFAINEAGTITTSLASGLVKSTSGVLGLATAGTDYIAGGAGAATTTLTISGPFTTSATPVVFGSSPITATYYGLATTSTLTSSQLLVSNGAAGVYGVSTTTASCAGTASCSAFTILGAAPITITGSGLAAYDAWTHPAAGQSATTSLMLFNGAASSTQLSATRAYFGGTATTTITGAGFVGVGSSSPWAQLSVNPTSTNGTAPAFAIGSSTATSFVVTNAGNVGIGTTSQLAKLTVDGSIILPNNNSYRMLDNAGNGVSILTMSTANNVGYSGSTVSGSMQFSVPNATGAFQFLTGAGLTNVLQITNAGNVGIGTTTPFAKLSIAGAAGGTTNLFAISTSTAGFATSTAVKVDSNGNLSLLNGTTLTTPALTVGSLNGLLKGTAGVVSTATAGTDYVAGGAGAATTTLSTSGVLSFNANPVVFGSSPISLSITQSGSGADGYLSSTDWTSFNSRLSTSTFALLKDWNITTNIFGQSSLTPTTTLNIAVSGTGTSTFAGGLEAWRQISAPYFVATSSTATSTFQGGALLALAGGNVGIGTANPTAGLELGSITAGRNQIINATEGPEMAPALEAANWTASDGWSAGGGSLVKIAGVGTGTITPSGTFTVVAGRTYKVVVTLSAASGNLYDQVGGVAGRENLAAGTHTQYITAITSGKIIFTAGAAVTGTITSLSVKELTPGTGDLTVNGKLTLMSGIYSSAGVGAIDINSELGTIGLAGAKASTAGYGLNVTGNILASANIYATGFSYQSTSYLYLSEAANTASIRNSTSQQTLRTYNTYTDASNYERSALSGVQGQSVNITAETAGTGADNLNIVLTPSGTGYTLLNGNVGIGTTSPYRKLSVQGDAGISGNLSAANIVATGTLNVSGQTTLATSLSGLLKATAGVVSTAVAGTDYLTSAFQNWGLTTNIFGQSSLAPTTTQNIAVSGIGTSTFAGGLEAWRSISAPYFVATSTTATSTFNGGALFAVSGGNVGIGTISPSLKLTVAGGQILVGPADSTNSFINFYNTNYKIGASTGLELYTNTSDRIRFIEGSTERARFDAGGNFGIGTTSPYAKLSVVGQIVGAYFTGTTTATSTFGGSLAVTEVNATSTFAGGIDLSDGCYAIDGNCIGVPGSDGTVNTGAAGYFAYYPSAGTTVDDQTALYLSATGDIGIGTNGPTNYGAGYTALTIDDTTSGRIDISSNGIVQGVLYNSGSTFRVGNVNPNSVALITDDTEQLIIDGSGNVTVTSLGSGLVKSTSGVLSNATAGVDYLAAYDAFTHPSSGVSATTSGLIISASSTIGNGSATGGLTVSGNSTTTGNAIATTFVGNGSSNTLLSQNGTPIVTADVAGNNIAVGLYNAASGGSNSAFGLNNTATAATFSSAFGFGNTASGYLSSAFGSQNTASNNTSMAFGASNNVSGVQAAAFGYAITNAVDNSVMIGPGNTSKLTILNTQKAGFGSTTPYANLSVHANAGETNTTLFAIGSSTASATSTLFSVSNTGSVQTALGSGLVKSTSGVLGLATVGTDYIAGGAGAATTTVTCAGTASCTGFVAFGASPITITGSGLASYDAWTHPAAGQSATTSLMLFNGNASSTQLSATRAYFGGTATTTITAAGFVGVGSSSPWAQLSVNPTSTNGTAPAFAIGSSTDTSFVVWNNGNVSIGTTTASTQKLTVAGTLRLDNGGGWAPLSGVNFQGIMSGGSYYFGKTFDSGNSGVFVYDNSGGYFTISNNNSTLDNGVKISDNLTVTGAATFANASTTNFSANTLAVGGTGTTSISSTGALTTPSLTIGSLSGLLKGTAGAVSVATPGTDYIAGGAGAATTTVSCSGSASCTSFVAFGSSPITISSSALTAYDAWTHPAAGQSATTSLMLFNGNASSTQLSAGTAYFGTTGTTTILGTGFVGVGTSSPWARLSINPIAADGAAPAFAIGSSTGTTFVVTNGGNVGIGTTSPQAPLHIQSDNGMRIQESSNVRYFYVTPPVAGADTVFGNNGTSAGFRFSNTSIGTFLTMNGSSGSVGIGTTTPFAKLSVAGSAGGTTNLFAVSTSTAGFSTSTALYVDSAGSLIAGLNGSKVGIGTTSPGAALEVKGSGTGSVLAGAWGGDSTYGAISLNGSLATGNANFYSNYGGTSLVINRPTGGSVSFRENNAIQMYLEGTTGNFGVGTSTPYRRLSVQGSAGISGDLAAANVVATGTLQVSGQTTLATSLSGLLKATAGVVSNATAGTDYIAGGAGAATTTLTISGPFTTSATPVVFGSSPITATYYGLATTSTLTSSQLLVSNGAAGVYGVSTTSATINNGLTGTLTTLGSGQTIGLAAIAANTVLANGTGGSAVPTAVATSTFFGTGTGGQVLTWNNGVPQWVATTTYSAPLVFSGGNLTITQSGTGANGYLSSTDFNTFNNKISSTSLSGASVISYNSGTGVITTTPGTFAGSGTYTFPAGVVAPYASSTAFSSGYASSTNAFFGTVGIGDSSPMSRLAIVATTTGTTSQSQIRLESLGTGNIASGNLIGGIDFVSHDSQILDANGIVSASIQAVANRTHTDTTVDTDLVFSNVSNVGTTLTEFMRITGTDPKLGIGTTSPLAKLSITGKSSAANNRTFGLANSSNVDTFYVQDNGSAYLAGSFGIGSTTPFRALSVQGNVGISGDLSAANMIATGTLQVTGQTTLASSLTGLLKGTAGVVSVATAGTDYVAGGAGAATSTVTCAGTASCTGFVAFAASPITITGSGISSYDAWTHPNTLGYSATTSVIGIGTTTPQWALTIASSTKAQLTLSDGSLTSAPYNFRSINGNFYLSTSSPTTFATSSVSALSINTNSDVTISHALSVFGSGATGSGILLDVGSGQFTVNPNGVAIGGDQTPDAMLEVIGGQFLLSSDSSAGNNGNRLSFDSASGYNGIGTTSSRWALAIASSTAPQLTLADGSLTSAPINFRSINGNLFISTSSPTTFATTSSSVLSINGATGSTTALKLDVSGNATSSFGGGINLASGCFSINNVCVGSGSQTPWTSNINGGGFTLTNTSQIGVGTSTPWATLAVNPVAGAAANQFVVGSSTATAFVINNSGNVAIGTTTADLGFGSTFTTLTAHNPTGGGVLRASSASIQTELYSVEGSGFGVAGTRTNHPFTLRTNNTEYVRLTTAGSFGIGSSTPWGQLSVNPNALGSGVPEFVVGSSTATHFVVNGAGNVGIGTSSPYAKLSVAGSAVLGGFSGGSISLNNGAASDAYLYFDSAFHLAKNGTGDRITILDAGNVGIGTSGPSSPLNVNFSGGDDDGVIRIDATTRPSLMFVNTGVQAWAQFIDTSDSNKFKIGPANSGVAAATAVLTMTTSGNVGIGTTTPGTKLNIAGGGLSIEGDSAGNFSSPSNGLHLSFNTTSNTGRLLSLQNGVAWRALQIDGSSVVFNTQSGGNVGVGTTSPTRKLTVYSAANPRISVDSNADGNPGFELYEGNVRKWLLFNNTDDSFRIRDGGSSDFFTITSTGNVGIGVAGSAQTLHVASAGSREGYPSSVLFSDTTDTTEGIFLGYSSTGNYGIIAASRLGTAWHNLALAPSGGNVGIGSTSPNANLTVQSSGSVGNVAMGTWASNSGYGAIYLNSAFANGSNYNFLSAIGDALYINRPSATAIRFREANGGTDQFTLNSGGGSIFPDGNLSVCTGGACPSGTPAGNGNIIAETAIGVASSTPWAGLAIASGKAIVVAENTLATSTSMTVDWRNGNQQLVRTGTSATTISFSGFIEGQKLVLTVCNPNATAGAISWGTQVLWAGGTAPTQTTTANKCDVWSFLATTATSTLKIFGTQSANF